jgi:hypothetical protein
MEYVKTVQKFVAGSNKFFDIFNCTVDEVEEFLDSSGRKQIRIVVNGEEIKGMHNKRVFEHLVANEGTPSFVVLWKSNKGNYLISYAWELWEAYIKGDASMDVQPVQDTVESEASYEAFVYLWVDKSNDMKYIGTHKGTTNDGYICSNDRMLAEHKKRPEDFVRTILAYGTQKQMHELETLLLIQLGAATGNMWYNLSNNLRK